MHALLMVRDIVRPLISPKRRTSSCCRLTTKARPARPLRHRAMDVRAPYDVHEIIGRIVDGSALHEFKSR